ncbi:hypothetical protein POSPLADRAFT_1066973 [Postia placenta MAD-698-R-SB12]|uniref:Zn(2)-C6 fungal-type domain-containing protein n=1 Tax=Postia placenta MAD-698-R-SB12 TaxID=670580 RepID=A0A1X6MUI4_9APHY|nr:hypothetical protein POSPLADRAFT_1066973 [Postia placenta MAD-698-R-SB12]OSX59910.1 hypothetical protein POSPLADRAFT_1066973 [Postia placenta MAD-698-R-SB12]
MVAGRRTGKTSFLRLLLDTSLVAPSASADQLLSVAKFVQGCGAHTSHVRTVSLDIDLASEAEDPQHLNLTLIDTPSLDFKDDAASQRTVSEILRHVDARFAESVEDERKALTGNHHVHLCIYFLDPEHIVPPSVSAPPVPLVSRTRNNSLSVPEAEPVFLDPPVTTNPMLCKPTLPAADIATIRRLSARVNVLPVIARADMLTNDRLAAVKLAIRRDLAEAGIGFGIFDLDTFTQYPQFTRRDAVELMPSRLHSETPNGYANHMDGASTKTTPPPSTPLSLLRLPFALISPDIYAHSDGVSRPTPSRHELMYQYSPLPQGPHIKTQLLSKMGPGKFIRSYRWGSLDVMDVGHCDFVYLRQAIFHHMQTLQKYTRDYLFQKYRQEVQPPPKSMPTRGSHLSAPPPRLLPLSQGTRPILAIDTTPSQSTANPPVLQAPVVSESSPRTATSSSQSPLLFQLSHTGSQRSRAKKITVACNFCRARKLKCDGGRPACSQCFKRSAPCDYQSGHKRRGNGKARRHYGGSDSEGESVDELTFEMENPAGSPEVTSHNSSRRNSNVSMLLTESLPPLGSVVPERRGSSSSTVLPPIAQATSSRTSLPEAAGPELPPITTLSVPPAPASREDQSQLSSLKQESGQMTQRRRTASASGKGRTAGHGSKIVACNICRARKTRCDGAHPACGSCARRQLPCNYVNDPSTSRSRNKSAATTPSGPSGSTSARSSPSTQMQYGSAQENMPLTNGVARRISAVETGLADANGHPSKKMRMAAEAGRSTVAIGQTP